MAGMAGYASIPMSPQPAQAEWRASALLHRAVVHARKVELAGQVLDVVFNPQTSAVAALVLGPRGIEGNLVDLLHEVFGTAYGLTIVTTDQVLAMDADVVMLDMHPGRAAAAAYAAHLPRLSAARGLPVITMHGRRLGRFVDLLVAGDGRRIAGYVVAQPMLAHPGQNALLDRTTPTMGPADQPDTRATPSATSAAQPSTSTRLIVVAASNTVRFGRDLIVVGAGEPPRMSVPSLPVAQQMPEAQVQPIAEPAPHITSESAAQPWPAGPSEPFTPPDAPHPIEDEQPAESPDAPTEAMQS
jgi:sporulation protein YlmC with PRC-barrel domain